jgi:hypothetical protein
VRPARVEHDNRTTLCGERETFRLAIRIAFAALKDYENINAFPAIRMARLTSRFTAVTARAERKTSRRLHAAILFTRFGGGRGRSAGLSPWRIRLLYANY